MNIRATQHLWMKACSAHRAYAKVNMCGLFQADDLQEAAKGILVRAAEKGVITGVPDLPMQRKRKGGKRDKRIAEAGDEVTSEVRRKSLFKIEEEFLLEVKEEQATADEIETPVRD